MFTIAAERSISMTHQWQRLPEIQRIPLDTMQHFARKVSGSKSE